MIVVVIIGILATLALPAYEDYTIRAKMAEVIMAATPCKNQVTEFSMTGQAPTLAWDARADMKKEYGCVQPDSQYVADVDVANYGVITVLPKNIPGYPTLSEPWNNRIYFEPCINAECTSFFLLHDNGFHFYPAHFKPIRGWRCGVHKDLLPKISKWLPAECRNVIKLTVY